MRFLRCSPIVLLIFVAPVLAGSVSGIANFDQVDVHVYRGGQPTEHGFEYLATLGVTTVLDLREAGGRSQAEERTVTRVGMKYVNVPMSGLTPPTDAEITRILALLEDSKAGPVFVHCWRGADRTGAVIAAYHIDHDNWDNTRALMDAKAHHMGSIQLPRQKYIRNFRPHTVDAKAPDAGGSAVTAGVAN